MTTNRSIASKALRRLAEAIVGPHEFGYLRPWMSADDPAATHVFIIGSNAATPFPAGMIDREEYIDALVRGGEALRALYLQVRGGRPSPTRMNTDALVARLERHGVRALETNVWSMPTKSLAILRRVDHRLVKASGEVLPRLIEILDPAALIVHGVTATEGLADTLGRRIDVAGYDGPRRTAGSPVIWSLPSLSPPAANRWLPTADSALEALAIDMADDLRRL